LKREVPLSLLIERQEMGTHSDLTNTAILRQRLPHARLPHRPRLLPQHARSPR
jgi:hypothetical protein